MPNDSKEKIMNVDFFDLCWEATKRGEGLYDQERIERLIARCAEEGFDALYWRVSGPARGALLRLPPRCGNTDWQKQRSW